MKLEDLRKEIDKIDGQLLDLLNRRMEVVRQVGELKKSTNSSIYRPEREKQIIDNLANKSQGLLTKPEIEAIFLEIFAISRNLELPEKIVYLGPEGSFTHQAAESRFGGRSEYLALSSIQAVFDAVNTERARFGVVPIENNQEGIVNEAIDLLGTYDLRIVAEIPMSIHFSFATKEDQVHNIKKIYSKDIAFRQCKNFIRDTFEDAKEIELVPVNSTSKAVKLASQEPQTAAICSHIAAKEFGLPILFHNIEDSNDNFTRFLILGKNFINERSGNDKTTILAKLGHRAGSLVSFLQDFYDNDINLTKIESRPAKEGKTFQYQFFIDFDGHFKDENVAEVLKKHHKEIRLLGSYVKLC